MRFSRDVCGVSVSINGRTFSKNRRVLDPAWLDLSLNRVINSANLSGLSILFKMLLNSVFEKRSGSVEFKIFEKRIVIITNV